MSTKYQQFDAVPTEVLAKRLDELSDAVVARMKGNNAKFKREFTCSIPCELDRDADVVLCEAAIRLSKQEKKIAELERRELELTAICCMICDLNECEQDSEDFENTATELIDRALTVLGRTDT